MLECLNRACACDPHFLSQDQTLFYDQDFLDDRNDDCVSLLAYGRGSIDLTADRNVLDLDVLSVQIRPREAGVFQHPRADPDPAGLDRAGRNGQFLLRERNDPRLFFFHGQTFTM